MSTTLILATTLSFLNVHSSFIGKFILKWVNKPTNREKELLIKKAELKAEQTKFNMVDNFASYSKIQRKVNKIEAELNDAKGDKNAFVVQIAVNYGIKIAFALLLFVLSIYYKNTPVFEVDSDINLVPFTKIISYPNDANRVSFHFWVMCCSVIAKLIKI